MAGTDLQGFPIRTINTRARQGALDLAGMVEAAIAKGAAVCRVTPEMIVEYERRAMGIATEAAKARTNRGGNSAAKRATRVRANAWKNGARS
ncbi:hypothetical protein [Azospirillum picis]|uniref:Uncharacterized protein n=1 Tax=Azospirillum picis TaxID=488438 RepID=A0ABU0MPH5_9PROT|nr:hypothetical protein [Azospirillum picis]MBP2301546.1 hypothetical protein [Azospirillum picis]MDQ0535378.1 hypothetical protein [Azospirillum picis]